MPIAMLMPAVLLAFLRFMTHMPDNPRQEIELQEVVRNWETIAKQLSNASIQFVTTRDDGVITGSWLRSGRCRLVRAAFSKPSGRYLEEVYAENEDYSFYLARTEPNRPWTLLSLISRSDTRDSSGIDHMLDVNGVAVGQFPLAVQRTCAIELIKSPAFTVDSVSYTSEHLVSLAFHLNERQEQAARDVRLLCQEGVLTLDPARGFAVVGSDIVVEGGTHVVQKFVHVPRMEGSAANAAVQCGTGVSSYQKPNDKLTETGQTEFVSCESGKGVPAEEFRLTAFGLPEPGVILGDQRGRSWWWIGAGGLAIVLFGLWVYFRQPGI